MYLRLHYVAAWLACVFISSDTPTWSCKKSKQEHIPTLCFQSKQLVRWHLHLLEQWGQCQSQRMRDPYYVCLDSASQSWWEKNSGGKNPMTPVIFVIMIAKYGINWSSKKANIVMWRNSLQFLTSEDIESVNFVYLRCLVLRTEFCNL